MIIVMESAAALKAFIGKTSLNAFAAEMVTRMILAFILHRGRMSCSQAAGSIASLAIHRGQLTRFLARPRWQSDDFNAPLRTAMLQMETGKGKFFFILDATLTSQSGRKTQNTHSTGNRRQRPKKGRRHNKKKIARKRCHTFTFGLLITPSGYRIPWQIPHYTKEYCEKKGLTHRTTAEAAADLIRGLPLPEEAEVVVLGDTAYDAKVVQEACEDRGYIWIVPANPERVYEGLTGQRPKVRSRLEDWTSLSLKTIRLRASTGKYAKYRRLSPWRVGPKQKPRVYYAYQEKCEVRSVGRVQLVFSTMKPDFKKATPDHVKILMTNALDLSVSEVIEMYSLRWQIELFFKELKSTLGFAQYSFQEFSAVEAWVQTAITTVLFLEQERAKRMRDRRLSKERRRWWEYQRLHGLCTAFRQECQGQELKFLSEQLEKPRGIAKLKRLLAAALPAEYRTGA
jgi:IS4 transposase